MRKYGTISLYLLTCLGIVCLTWIIGGKFLPKEWLDTQEALQKQIVARERQFNMRPILPAFAGHVPSELKRIYPEAKISRMSSWGGFEDKYRSHLLIRLTHCLQTIQKEFLEEQN